MVLQKVVEEKQLAVTDTLIDDNNAAIQVNVSCWSMHVGMFFWNTNCSGFLFLKSGSVVSGKVFLCGWRITRIDGPSDSVGWEIHFGEIHVTVRIGLAQFGEGTSKTDRLLTLKCWNCVKVLIINSRFRSHQDTAVPNSKGTTNSALCWWTA